MSFSLILLLSAKSRDLIYTKGQTMCSGDPRLRWRHPLAGGGMSPQTHRLSLLSVGFIVGRRSGEGSGQ